MSNRCNCPQCNPGEGNTCPEAQEKPLESYILDNLAWVIKSGSIPGWKVGQLRWAAVRDFLGAGSIKAYQICRWAGCDPDEIKGRAK